MILQLQDISGDRLTMCTQYAACCMPIHTKGHVENIACTAQLSMCGRECRGSNGIKLFNFLSQQT